MKRILTLTAVLATLLATSAPVTSQAQDRSWTEAKLVSHDELEILYGLADMRLKSGKIDSSRAALLASTEALRHAVSRAHLPAVSKQLRAYQSIAPGAYASQAFAGNEQDFRALIAEHQPGLLAAAEAVSLPPTGERFSSPADRVQRVVAATESVQTAADAAKAYAMLAPNPEAHLQFPEAQPVAEAMRQIVFALISLNDHQAMATEVATTQAATLGQQTDAAVAGEKLGMISMYADQELDYGTYLQKLGQDALGQAHIDHAKAAIDKEQAIREAQIAANRLPAETYAGGDANTLRELAKTQFLNAFPGDEVLAVKLNSSGFAERREWVKLSDGGWSWRRIRRFQWAHIAHRPASGGNTCHTYPVRIEQQWDGGAWGAYYTYKPVHIYGFSMLCENIGKS